MARLKVGMMKEVGGCNDVMTVKFKRVQMM